MSERNDEIVERLKRENDCLKAKNNELEFVLHDTQTVNEAMRQCGKILKRKLLLNAGVL